MIGKVLIDKGDDILIEEPGYLGAIQAFSQYQPHFCGVTLLEDGPDIGQLEEILRQRNIKFAYTVPNFQNPKIQQDLLIRRRNAEKYEIW